MVVTTLSRQLNIPLTKFVAIGDSKYDISMFKVVGLSIAFHPKDKEVKRYVDVSLESGKFTEVLNYL